ncbi:MAG: patatin [Firmicutes bacterium HGW-Firmicutes-20]|nr:MAG: patatin [Firmicutes bacterium HGW-Firmicutes-20]PKM66895.1 MAG: patatin [Firmicutes bacterium HGW-Firmicutes-19]
MFFRKKVVGIALSGGGSRGVAHLGVLKAFEELGVNIQVLSGTSAGSIAATLYASGLSTDEIYKVMKDKKFIDFAKIILPVDGLMNLDNLRKNLNEIIKNKDFSDMSKKLYIALTNLYTGEIEYRNSGNVIDAVIASSSIPILFSPVEIDGQKYVDGGVLDNLPIKPLLNDCDIIIAVDVMTTETLTKIENLHDIAVRTFQLSISSPTKEMKRKCNLLIEPHGLSEYNILDVSHFDHIYKIGYYAVMSHPKLPKLLAKIKK